ncbi:MAG TPA: MBL fold metallo-hydrolase [Vicinamibacterales bacterium]|nr:MBL fold metallo-hydrolase [Vicinamibacterales bacterium]
MPLRVFAGIVVAVVAVLAGMSVPAHAPGPKPLEDWELVVLGIAQDAGIPHLGCQQEICVAIREGKRQRERVASLGLVNRTLQKAYVFDATPDFPSQIDTLTGGRPPDGVFLTHGHIGHYTGLMYLGRESVDAGGVPVYATERMTTFLKNNGPWSLLASRRNIDLRQIDPGRAVDLGDGIKVTAYPVPHRDEFTDTVGYLIESPAKKVLYIPDIDQWQRWGRSIRDMAEQVDYAFLDGTFGSPSEIPGRSIDDIPHPMMAVTRDLLRGVKAQVWFIHINHTNKQIDANDVAKDGQRIALR